MSTINYTFDRLKIDVTERSHIHHVITQLKDRYSVSKKSIVELGSGSGSGANLELLCVDNQVLGVEGLADAAEYATNRGIKTIVANLDMQLPIASDEFDWVICLDVLEHLNSPEFALKEAHRLLKSDGKLLINVPNHFTLSGRIRMLMGRGIHWNNFFPLSHDWNNPHIRFFTHQSISELIELSGFDLVADLSAISPAVPMLQQLKKIGLGRLAQWLARHKPGLFAGGFFLLAQRRS